MSNSEMSCKNDKNCRWNSEFLTRGVCRTPHTKMSCVWIFLESFRRKWVWTVKVLAVPWCWKLTKLWESWGISGNKSWWKLR